MSLVIVNAVVVAACIGLLVVLYRGHRGMPQSPHRCYVPRGWYSSPWTNWLADHPSAMFWYLVFFPTAGLVAGIVLLVLNVKFGAILILAALVGAFRVAGPARRAYWAGRSGNQR